MDREKYESDLSSRINEIQKLQRETEAREERRLKLEAEADERQTFRQEHEQTFPRTLYEWEFPAGQGYFCRIVETKPGIVRFEEAHHAEDPDGMYWLPTDKPMGCANEMISMAQEIERLEAFEEEAEQSRRSGFLIRAQAFKEAAKDALDSASLTPDDDVGRALQRCGERLLRKAEIARLEKGGG